MSETPGRALLDRMARELHGWLWARNMNRQRQVRPFFKTSQAPNDTRAIRHIRASLQAVLDEACRAVCPECRRGARYEDDTLGHVWCEPIRRAFEGGE